jgi:hypothetical protein
MIDDDDELGQLAGELLDRLEEAERKGAKPVLTITLLIHDIANDPLLADSVMRRAAKAAEKKQDRLEDLCLLLARFMLAQARGQVMRPAAYLGSSLKRLVMSWGVSWVEEVRDFGRRR